MEEALISSLLAKNILLKVTEVVNFSMNNYEQDMIVVGNENQKNKNKDRWNCCHHMPMLPLLGGNHRLPLLHMAKRFIWINEENKCNNEFTVGYMINPGLNAKKNSREQGKKCMFTTFGEITQPFIKPT